MLLTHNEVSFEPPRDRSECPGSSCHLYRYSHAHCADCDGDPMEGEGGGGWDGSQLAGYSDGTACDSCMLIVHLKCATKIDGKSYCRECVDFIRKQIDDENLVLNNISNAAKDLGTARQKLERETNPSALARAAAEFDRLQMEFGLLGRTLASALTRSHSTPLPGIAA